MRARVTPAIVLVACLAAAAHLTPAATADEVWRVRFIDVAASLGLTRAIVYGDIDRKRFIIETNGCGVATVDLDDDGWADVVTLNGTRLEPGTRRNRQWPADEAPVPRVYHNVRGTLVDATAGSGLDAIGWASSLCAGDVDGDGRVDLFVTYFGRNLLYRNRGGLKFEDVTARAGLAVARDRWGSGCSLLDYDRDGDLDLFVANYLTFDLAGASEPGQGTNCQWKGVPVNCGPKGLPTDTNLLYRNDGAGRFTDVSTTSGIAAVTGRYSMTAAAADYDGDGWIDLYVAADSTAAILYHNNRDGTFTDVALASGSAYNDLGAPQAGMGLAIGDVDGNGSLDILKTHFADDIPALYRNRGAGVFEDVATETGLAVQNRFVQWGAGLPDLDRDGWMDVFYVTGNVYPEVEARLPQYPHRSPRVVFQNRSGRFVDVSNESGAGVTAPQSSRGAAFADLDNDGDLDVVVMNMNAPPSVLRNDYPGGGNHWLSVSLRGERSNRQGVGATIAVTTGTHTQARAVLSQSSYYSVDDLRPFFGLGTHERADRIVIRWPSGIVDTLERVPVDRVITVREGQSR